jgi:Tol biopolymer transport system component
MEHPLKLTFKSLRLNRAGLMRTVILLLAVFCGGFRVVAQTTENVELLSVNSAGTHAGNGASSFPESSSDGRFVVFTSDASDLVPNDTNGALTDIFVRDLQQHTTTLVSVNTAGTASGNGASSGASITPDGRFVVFMSEASDLVANDTNGTRDVFVRDLTAQTTTLVSLKGAGTGSGGGASSNGRITPDGRYVVFTSSAEDLVAADTNQRDDVFRRDLLTSTTVLVSINTAGTNGGNGNSSATAITPDGRYVLFASAATDLTANDTNGSTPDFFRRDLQTNTTALASVNSAGTGSGNGPAVNGVMSDDGQVVAFESSSTNLVPAEGSTGFTFTSIYAHDFAANTTTLISERQIFRGGTPSIPPATSPRISSDGRHVFYVRTENFIGGLDTAGSRDRVFRRDRQTSELLELPFVATGVCDSGFNCRSIISKMTTSHDGRYVAYMQREQPHSNNTPPVSTAIVIRDMVGGGIEIVSGLIAFANSLNDFTLTPGNIVNGGKLAFSSGVSHSSKDTNASEDVYFFTPTPPPRLFFNLPTYFSPENQTAHLHLNTINVRRRGYLIDSTVTVQFTTSDGTATAGSDYINQTGTLTFAPGEAAKDIFIPVINDDIVEPDETVNLTLSNPTGNAILGSPSSATFTIQNDDQYRIQFSAANYNASEAAGSIPVTVTFQGGNPSGPISVDYSTSDGTARERSDYITARGTLTFAPGETSKTIRVFVVDDNFVEGDETINLSLTNATGTNAGLGSPLTAELKILDNDSSPPTTNPVDDAQFFVRQHYLDFLNREPDTAGFNFWTNQITQCGTNAQCREVKHINVSAAFFLSIEFQRTGVLAYLSNKAAFGPSASGSPAPVLYGQFIRDVQQLQQNLVFGQPGFDAQLEANKQEYFANLVARPSFAIGLATPPAQFVDALFTNAGITPSTSERNAAIDEFGPATNITDQAARSRALRRVAENTSFAQAEFRSAFVTMEYFGYLRRDPDAGGFNFWLSKLNQFSGDFIRAEMVKAFISSDEYRQRFGP